MRIFYDVKKRRIIIRSAIAVISLFSIIMILKAFTTLPSVTPTLASDTDTGNPTNVAAQNTAYEPVGNSSSSISTNITSSDGSTYEDKNKSLIVSPPSPFAMLPNSSVTLSGLSTSKPISVTAKNTITPTTEKSTIPTLTSTAVKTAVHTANIISPTPTKDVLPTIATIIKPIPTKTIISTATTIVKPTPIKTVIPAATTIVKPTPIKIITPNVANNPSPIVTKTDGITPKNYQRHPNFRGTSSDVFQQQFFNLFQHY